MDALRAKVPERPGKGISEAWAKIWVTVGCSLGFKGLGLIQVSNGKPDKKKLENGLEATVGLRA